MSDPDQNTGQPGEPVPAPESTTPQLPNPSVPNPVQDNPFSAPLEASQKPAPPQGPTEAASALDGIIPTNPLAAVSCYAGIFGMITCLGGLVLGPFAIVMGIMSLKIWKARESNYGKTMSSVRAWIGIVTGTLGFILGLVVIFQLWANR